MLKTLAWLTFAVLIAVSAWATMSRHRFLGTVQATWQRLERSAPHRSREIGTLGEPREDESPEAIQRFIARALTNPERRPGAIVLEQQAELRMTPEEPFRPITARQIIRVDEPGFLWVARAGLSARLPGLDATIVDGYVDGNGWLEVRIMDTFRVASAEGDELARGELMRYLAEIAWVPHALVFNRHLEYREIEPTVVEVSAESRGGVARVRLEFDESGDLRAIEADDRPRTVGAGVVNQGWRGEFWDYRQMHGSRIPTRGQVGWETDEGLFIYWRGTVTAWEAVGYAESADSSPGAPAGAGE